MDYRTSADSTKFLKPFAFVLLLLSGTLNAEVRSPEPSWVGKLEQSMKVLESRHPGQLGLYVKDLASGQEFSLRAEQPWYIASGVKLPIAVEVLRQIDAGKFSLDSQIRLEEGDRVDGAGSTNAQPTGALLSVRYLLEQMIIFSDNTASDLLIRRIGLDSVNRLARDQGLGFSEITTLADVRRHLYGGFHPLAGKLRSADFLRLKTIPGDARRVRELARLTGLKSRELKFATLTDGYDAYYAKQLNSAPLKQYSRIIETVVNGNLLSASSRQFLLDLCERVQTGRDRIKASLPPTVRFAHKTGTQFARFCDFGVAWPAGVQRQNGVVIAACVRQVPDEKKGARALSAVGAAILASGVMKENSSWPTRAAAELTRLDQETAGNIGVYAKRIGAATELDYNAQRPWYLSSTVKLPVAIALLKRVEAGTLQLDQEITLLQSDFVDGLGDVQFKKPGTRLSVRYLLEQMLTNSDSTAADILIRLVGEKELNHYLKETLGLSQFGPITTLVQVRTDAYSELHPNAKKLGNTDFIKLRKIKDHEQRLSKFCEMTGTPKTELRLTSLAAAFERYYERGMNSAPLNVFGSLLEKLANRALLSEPHTEMLLKLMENISTGNHRVKAGLPEELRFAQKTGTQVGRMCNVGIIRSAKSKADPIVLAACVEKFSDPSKGELLLQKVGAILTRAGAFDGS